MSAYVAKGEIKTRYFNPDDLFDEIHVISADTDRVDAETLRTVCGRARAEHHTLGPWRVLSYRRNPYVGPYHRQVIDLIRSLAPDVVRAYTPLETGWLARASAIAVKAPYVISIHGNYDLDIRTRLREQRLWRGYAYYSITRMLVEPAVLRDAAYVICAYGFAARYVRALRQDGVEVVYNRAYLDQFRPVQKNGPFTVLFVGRCDKNKGQELLIRSMAKVPGKLLLIGDGPTLPGLEQLARDCGLSDRVEFIPRVPHSAMPNVYARASVFASAIIYGGIQIPHLEAMASGLPIVVTRPTWEREPEQLADVAVIVERRPDDLAAALSRLAEDRDHYANLAARSVRRAADLSGERMEAREREIYEAVLRRGRRVA